MKTALQLSVQALRFAVAVAALALAAWTAAPKSANGSLASSTLQRPGSVLEW